MADERMQPCQTCKWFRPLSEPAPLAAGHCRKSAPPCRTQPLSWRDIDPQTARWPLVDGLGCGGWQPVALGQKDGAEGELAQVRAELEACRKRCEGLAERVAAQSELLTRRAQKGDDHGT